MRVIPLIPLQSDIQDQGPVQMLLDGSLAVVVEEETLETTKHEEELVHQELLLHMLVLVKDPLPILLTLTRLKQYRWEDLDQDPVVEEEDGLTPQ